MAHSGDVPASRDREPPHKPDATPGLALDAALPTLADADELLLLGNSPVMLAVRRELILLAQSDFPTWIGGPSGSGKRAACRWLHVHGPRSTRPYVVCDVNQLAGNLVLPHLVGVAKGAFTGADRDRPGAIEAAHLGVLVLDEIADASEEVQRNLLTLVSEKHIIRIGETRVRPVDVRVIGATNADLADRVQRGAFRADLYHRLGKEGVRLPALVEHPEDIPLLISYYFPRKARQVPIAVRDLTPGEMDLLQAYAWPGNVRELERVLEQFVVLGRIAEDVVHAVEATRDWRTRVEDVLRKQKGNISAAARDLGVSRPTLYAELERQKRAGGKV